MANKRQHEKAVRVEVVLKEAMWRILLEACHAHQDGEPTDDVIDLGRMITQLYEYVTPGINNDDKFCKAMAELFPERTQVTNLELPLTTRDRKVILENLDDQCLSEGVKEAIRAALAKK